MASPFLKAADASPAALDETIRATIAELQTVMLCTGCATLSALRHSGVLRKIEA
jgi:isopentenyl-diphosphate delta-isomerase